MAKYKITTKTGESYLITSPKELTQDELAGYAENPMGNMGKTSYPPSPPRETPDPFMQPIKDYGKRFKQRAESVYAPTALGSLVGAKPGGVVESIVGTPERASRLIMGAGANLVDLATVPVSIAMGGYNAMTGGAAGRAVESTGIPKTLGQLAGKYEKFKESLSPAAQANLTATEGGLTVLAGAGGVKAPGIVKSLKGTESSIDKAIDLGVNKGIKPTVKNKSNYSAMSQFNEKAKDAVKTIAENKDMIKLVDDAGYVVAHPRTAAEMAQAIEKTKQVIYKQYHDMAVAAGDKEAEFNFKPIGRELNRVSKDLKNNPKIRNYAQELKTELEELSGAAPEIVEARIKDLNKSLTGFYEGRVSKVKAEIDASTANLMREQLDKSIENSVGAGYQGLKNKYGSLKAIEKEVNHRAIVNARKATKSTIDITDVFTGGELVAGIMTLNPALIAKGIVGRSIKEIHKELNRPDRYIEGMFKKAYAEITPGPKTFATPEKAVMVETPDILTRQPAYSRKGVDIRGQVKKETANRERAKSRPASDIGAWHKLSKGGLTLSEMAKKKRKK
jgi:hypothetical protein